MSTSPFSSNIPNKERAVHFITIDPDGEWQQKKVSQYSPSHVKHEELLARSIDFPLRQEPRGGINDSLFQDAFTIGASVQRIPNEWEQCMHDIHSRYEERANNRRLGIDGREPNNEWRYIGSVHITAGELRSIQTQVFRKCRVRVYDAGYTQDNALHADVIVDANDLDKSLRKLLRVMLMNEACRRGLYVSPYIAPLDDALLSFEMKDIHMP